MKVWLGEKAHENSGGMFRVYDGLYNYLPEFGIEIVRNKNEADVVNHHIGIFGGFTDDKPMVVSSHGMLWKGHGWGKLAGKVNRECLAAYRRADVVTAPSQFVARSIARYTGANTRVVQHGINSDVWLPSDNEGYVLWNKARSDMANNPRDMNELASLFPNTMFYSTFGEEADNVYVYGNVSPLDMQDITSKAGVYLATSLESGGPCFGVLEAMSCAVPVLSWDFGGTAEAVIHGETGYLAELGNYEDLAQGLVYIQQNRDRLGDNARQYVLEDFQWQDVIPDYVNAYQGAIDGYNDLVSVIVPCYNLGEYLPRCLSSVLEQSYKNIEVIVIDDASTDESADLIAEYASYDSRIKPIFNDTNQHVSSTRNRGITESSGTFILPLDADDALYPDAIENMVRELQQDRNIDIVAGKLKVFHETSLDSHGQDSGWPNNANLKLQLEGFNRLPYSSMYRKKVWNRVGGYRSRIRNGTEDADFWTRALALGYKATILDDYTLRYTHREESLGKQNAKGNGVWLSWFPWTAETSPAMASEVNNYSPPLVSIVIPVGPGHFKYLQACLDSVIAQTEEDWEVIVVNDTGLEWELPIEGMGFARIINSSINCGVAAARNTGIHYALSDRIIFLDVDDILQPHAIQSLVLAQDYADGYIYGDWYINTGGDVEYSEAESWNYEAILNRSLGPITGIYYRQHLLDVGGFTEDIPGWEDWDLQLKLLHEGICGTRLKTPLITYNMHLGHRRENNFSNRQDLLQYIREKHYTILKGKQDMACSSCGGKRTLSVTQASAKTGDGSMIEDTIKLKFTGLGKGRQRVSSKKFKGVYYIYSESKPIFSVFISDLEYMLSKRNPDNSPMYVQLDEVKTKAVEMAVEESPLVSEFVPPIEHNITELELEEHVIDKLHAEGYLTVGDLANVSDARLLNIKGIGKGRVTEIREALDVWTNS
jgi:glycosyltransferase involved in cell wall biosynthesis